MAHKIDDLRDHLFATLAALRDPDKPMDIDRAKAIADVARVVVESAKVEVQHLDLVGGRGSGFLPEPEQTAPTRTALTAVPHAGHSLSKGR